MGPIHRQNHANGGEIAHTQLVLLHFPFREQSVKPQLRSNQTRTVENGRLLKSERLEGATAKASNWLEKL